MYRLEAEDGGTRLTHDVAFEMGGLLRVAAGLLARLWARSSGREVKAAKRLLEAG